MLLLLLVTNNKVTPFLFTTIVLLPGWQEVLRIPIVYYQLSLSVVGEECGGVTAIECTISLAHLLHAIIKFLLQISLTLAQLITTAQNCEKFHVVHVPIVLFVT